MFYLSGTYNYLYTVDQSEKTQLDALVKSFNEFKETQYKFNTHCRNELGDISRGLYGDKKNNQPGIIDDLAAYDANLAEIRARVKSIERSQYKTGVWLGVGSAVLIAVGEFLRSLWK